MSITVKLRLLAEEFLELFSGMVKNTLGDPNDKNDQTRAELGLASDSRFWLWVAIFIVAIALALVIAAVT